MNVFRNLRDGTGRFLLQFPITGEGAWRMQCSVLDAATNKTILHFVNSTIHGDVIHFDPKEIRPFAAITPMPAPDPSSTIAPPEPWTFALNSPKRLLPIETAPHTALPNGWRVELAGTNSAPILFYIKDFDYGLKTRALPDGEFGQLLAPVPEVVSAFGEGIFNYAGNSYLVLANRFFQVPCPNGRCTDSGKILTPRAFVQNLIGNYHTFPVLVVDNLRGDGRQGLIYASEERLPSSSADWDYEIDYRIRYVPWSATLPAEIVGQPSVMVPGGTTSYKIVHHPYDGYLEYDELITKGNKTAQYAVADLNGDGKKDLIFYVNRENVTTVWVSYQTSINTSVPLTFGIPVNLCEGADSGIYGTPVDLLVGSFKTATSIDVLAGSSADRTRLSYYGPCGG